MAKNKNRSFNQQVGQPADNTEETTVGTEAEDNGQAPAEDVKTESQAPVVEDKGTEAVDPAPVVAEPVKKTFVEEVKETASKAASVVVEAVEKVVSKFEALVASIRAEGTVAGKGLVHAFDLYFETMLPGKPVDPDKGAKAQYAFWRALYTVIHSAPQEEFKVLWNLVLAYFNNHAEDIFHPRYVFRFSESWSASQTELDAFQRLLNLIHLTANPQTRAAGLKQVDLGRSLGDFFTEEDRQRLITFYR